MHPSLLRISNFTYQLPEERIALHPEAIRDRSKLLIYKDGEIFDSVFSFLPQWLPANVLLVRNNSKVIRARIKMRKPTGGLIEVFLLEPISNLQPAIALQQKASVTYKCMVGGAAKWKPETYLTASFELPGEEEGVLSASLMEKMPNHFLVKFWWQPTNLSFAEVLHCTGAIPLPPYISRKTVSADEERYQTVYAQQEGSVAAPTAGLHFTSDVLNKLKAKGVTLADLTLHVGAGTFQPVKAEIMQGHEMHEETIEISVELLNALMQNEQVVAIGTTTMRTLETIYWFGLRVFKNGDPDFNRPVGQWEPYSTDTEIKTPTTNECLRALNSFMQNAELRSVVCRTSILIAPGYSFKICKGLITNFHQPGSTLLLLVAACLPGNEWRRVYEHALSSQYRFLSYGDSSLLWLKT